MISAKSAIKPNLSQVKGFTLTEIAIVLGIIGLLLGAVWAAAGRVTQNRKTNEAATQILRIVAGYRALYGSRGIDNPTANADVTCLGMAAGIFPSDMLPPTTPCVTGASATYPIHPWGGIVEVTAWQNNNSILIAIDGLNQTACNNLADVIGHPADLTAQGYNASGTMSGWNSGWLPPYGNATPWTAGFVSTTACSSSGRNNILFGFAIK